MREAGQPVKLVRIGGPDAPPADATQPPPHPDFTLARAVLAKDRKATAEWVERFSGPVFHYVRSRLFPRTDLVDDLVQEVFVAAWQYLPGYRGTSPLGAWILGIARHKVEDHYRARLRMHDQWDDEGSPEPVDQSSPPADQIIDGARLSARAQAVLAQLPEQYATVLLWRYWEQRGSKEIGVAIGRTEKAVERLLARARENFKRRWQELYG